MRISLHENKNEGYTQGGVITYTISGVYKDGKNVSSDYRDIVGKEQKNSRYLYDAMFSICGNTDKGIIVSEAGPQSDIEGYLFLDINSDSGKWYFNVWFNITYPEPLNEVLDDLGLSYNKSQK